ncbi:hypothetical protein Dimus_024632, partial [Dionaea muscipula]
KGGAQEAELQTDPVVDGSPTTEELNREVDEILTCPLLSKALQHGGVEGTSSENLIIPIVIDEGMRQELREVAGIEKDEEIEGRGFEVVDF